MEAPKQMMKEWSGPGALVALMAWIVVQSSGVMPQQGKDGADLRGRVEEHDGRIERAWKAINSERLDRVGSAKSVQARLAELERTADRLGDRFDSQRAAIEDIRSTLRSMAASLNKIERTQDVMEHRLSAIAKQEGGK